MLAFNNDTILNILQTHHNHGMIIYWMYQCLSLPVFTWTRNILVLKRVSIIFSIRQVNSNKISYLEGDVGVFVHAKYLGFVHDGEGLDVVAVLL